MVRPLLEFGMRACRDRPRKTRTHIRHLEALGFTVTLEPAA
ncbi:hypothetical protein [Nocardioides sp.]